MSSVTVGLDLSQAADESDDGHGPAFAITTDTTEDGGTMVVAGLTFEEAEELRLDLDYAIEAYNARRSA